MNITQITARNRNNLSRLLDIRKEIFNIDQIKCHYLILFQTHTGFKYDCLAEGFSHIAKVNS